MFSSPLHRLVISILLYGVFYTIPAPYHAYRSLKSLPFRCHRPFPGWPFLYFRSIYSGFNYRLSPTRGSYRPCFLSTWNPPGRQTSRTPEPNQTCIPVVASLSAQNVHAGLTSQTSSLLLLPRSLVPTGKNSEHEPPKSLPQFSSSVPFFGVYIFPFSFVFSLSLFLLDFLSFSNTHTTHSLPSSGLAVLGIQKATDEPCRLSPTTFLTQPPSRRRRRLILVPLTLRTGNRTRKLPSGIPSCGPTGPMATPTIATLLPPTTASMSPI